MEKPADRHNISTRIRSAIPQAGKALVLASGGLDSTTLLALCVDALGSQNVEALAILYGQRHERELQSARHVTKYYDVPLHLLDLSEVFAHSNSSLLAASDAAIPQGTYAQQQKAAQGGPVSTYVPFRNGLFLSAAASFALSLNCNYLAYGAHADDMVGDAYPDCSPEFVAAMGSALSQGSGNALQLIAPFVQVTKADIVKVGLALQVPYELTWSCYEGGEVPCGLCGTCQDRKAAFAQNGAPDPLMPQD